MSHLLLTASDPGNIKHCTASMASDLTSFVLGGKPRASHGQDDVRLPGVRPGDQLGVDVLGVVRNTGRVLHNSLAWIGDSRPQRRVVIKFSCRVSSSDLFENCQQQYSLTDYSKLQGQRIYYIFDRYLCL